MICNNIDGNGLECICLRRDDGYSWDEDWQYSCTLNKSVISIVDPNEECSCPLKRAEALSEQLLNSGKLVDVFISVSKVEEE